MLPSVTKWQEANFLIGKRSKNSKLDNHTRPMQSDFGCNGWIPFAQNADTIEKVSAAKQTPQLHSATEICISAPPTLTVFH